ncbi:MAG: hypothetical protein Q7S24_02145, partial [bacterium]|nr:hypothetical protein [bacterium]
MKPKKLSFHPKLGAVLDLFFGLIFWWTMSGVKNIWWLAIWFVARLVLWLALIYLVPYVYGLRRLYHFLTLGIFLLGATALLLFMEWSSAWRLVGVLFAVMPAVSFWLLPPTAVQPSFVLKPFRRWRLVMSNFGIFGIWAGVFALITLNIFRLNFGWWLLAGTLISVWVAYLWCREYGISRSRSLGHALAVLAFIIGELAYVLAIWPIGYFASGFLMFWFWYIIWIMIRFYLSPTGINWKKQVYFLASNGILILIFLIFIIR